MRGSERREESGVVLPGPRPMGEVMGKLHVAPRKGELTLNAPVNTGSIDAWSLTKPV